MSTATDAVDVMEAVRERHVPTVSRLISSFESGAAMDPTLQAEVHAAGGSAHIIGVTGAPGSGKSTLVDSMVAILRARGLHVAVVAVDPSSSITGGAILGDRIRMQRHTLDTGVFTRSMSSRGSLGGVSRATVDAVGVLDAAGYDVVIVETVGVGQAEVDIIRIAHTTLVVSVPGLGDDIQMIKAGLIEVADIHVVNKADRADADKTRAELLNMLTLRSQPGTGSWAPPVLATVATTSEGVEELIDTFDRHLGWLRDSGELPARERRSAAARVKAIADDHLLRRLSPSRNDDTLSGLLDAVVERRMDPHRAADVLISEAANNTSTRLETPR